MNTFKAHPVFAAADRTVRFVDAGGGTYIEMDAITILL